MLSQHQESFRFLLNLSQQIVEAAYLLLLAKHLSLYCILQKYVQGFQPLHSGVSDIFYFM